MRALRYLSYIFILITLHWSCANQITLTGGEKDEIPPKVDTSKSTPNYQLRYYPKDIQLEFNEFINLSSPSKNIAISPPLLLGMEVKHRGKKVTVSFDEEEILKEKATYIINFGESITDFTEGNKLKNYSFVFSTGDYIDSLTLQGEVMDAFSDEPVQDITVMLYDNIEDSVVYKQKPFYFTKTEKDGSFKFENLRGDTFKIVAINDLNLNYLYEENSEQFAFSDSLVMVDTIEQNITLRSFQAESSPRFQDGELIHDGVVILKFDKKLEDNPVRFLGGVVQYMEVDNQNVKSFVSDIDLFPLKYVIQMDTLLDTISIRKPQAKERKDLPALKLLKSNVNSETGLHPMDTLSLEFNFPLDSLNYNLLNMSKEEIYIDSLDKRTIKVIDEWNEGGDYSLVLDSSSLFDIYGRTMDSTSFNFEIGRQNSFGAIEFGFDNIQQEEYFIITLLNDEDEIFTSYVDVKSPPWIIENLPPGSYSLKIIEDRNGDRKWNTGNYLSKRQPEKITNITLEPLESNRTNNESIDFSNIFVANDSIKTVQINLEK